MVMPTKPSQRKLRRHVELLMSRNSQQERPDAPGVYVWNGTDWGLSQKAVPGWVRLDLPLAANSMLVSPQLKAALLGRTNDPDIRDLIEAVEDAKITTLYALRMEVDTPEFTRIWNDAVATLSPRKPEVSITATGRAKKFVPYHTTAGHTRH